MGKFVMAIGLPGCGKTTYYNNKFKADYVHVSSDNIREELYGDVNDQEHNTEVFEEMYRRTKEHLIKNENVYYDATNISAKKRKHLISQIKKYTNDISCRFFAIPIDIVKEQNKKRDRVVPEYVIDRMFKNICIPEYEEGWNKIKVINLESAKGICEKLLNELMDIPHDNPHHSLTIGKHMCKASEEYLKDFNKKGHILYSVIRYHDLGKKYTKEFDENGVAHYYNHHNVGAYIYLCDSEFNDNFPLVGALLIYHHMDLYNKNFNKEKYGDILDRLEIINEYDIKGK